MDIRKYFGSGNLNAEKKRLDLKKEENIRKELEDDSTNTIRKKERKRKIYKLSSESDEEPLGNLKKSNKTKTQLNGIKHDHEFKGKSNEVMAASYFGAKKSKLQEDNMNLSQYATTDIERQEITPVLVATMPHKDKGISTKKPKTDQKSHKDKHDKIESQNNGKDVMGGKVIGKGDKTITKPKRPLQKPKKHVDPDYAEEEDEGDDCFIEYGTQSKAAEKKKGKKDAINSNNKAGEKVDPDDLKDESKLQSKKAYHAFLQRAQPQALGSKPLPEGKPNCLEGITCVITGVLDSIERDTAKELIEKYGGKVTVALSKKTNYLVVGREPGASKISKAQSLNTPQIDEEKLFELISSQPEKKSKYVIYDPENDKEASKIPDPKASHHSNKLPSVQPHDGDTQKLTTTFGKSNKKVTWRMNNNLDEVECITGNEKQHTKMEKDFKPTAIIKNLTKENDKMRSLAKNESFKMWVDKYKPQNTQEIIGQQGEKSSLHKLVQWLGDWFYNHAKIPDGVGKKMSKKVAWGPNQDPSQFKAALLSGPPGVGKTTSAILACKELGFTYTELNASNIRSKKCLKDLFSDSLTSYNISKFMKGASTGFRSHVLIMDEVDGMAGNEDRGGIQELIALIKTTKLPIICICNQRSDPKMRTLVNYCYDLRFPKPRLEQIKDVMMTMLFKEKVQIEPALVQQVIQGSNNDIRQVIHSLNFFSSDNKCLKYNTLAPEIKSIKKDIKLDDFEITRNVFMPSSGANSNPLTDKSDLFFMDYSIIPLFVEENYLQVQSFSAKKDNSVQLNLLSRAADCIADGDLISTAIQKNNNWSLLPLSAIATTVAPGEILKGYCGGMINFPSWFGKNSKKTKFMRMLKELKMHTTLRTFSDWQEIDLDYLPLFKTNLLLPLLQNESDGVEEVIKFMTHYYLQKEDLDNVMEMSKWGASAKDPFSQLNPKIKSSLTRSFNKLSPMVPYTSSQKEGVRKSSRKTSSSTDYTFGDVDEVEKVVGGDDYSDEENDKLDNGSDSDFDFKANKMIKKKVVKSNTAKKNPAAAKAKKK